jgi:cytochrome c peroxidase
VQLSAGMSGAVITHWSVMNSNSPGLALLACLLARCRRQCRHRRRAHPADRPACVASSATAELGKMLFFDPRLSKSGFISCNSCHNLSMGGSDNLKSSIGHGWQKGPINAPTVLNSRFNLAQFWDGRAADLKAQAGGPIANPGEMAYSHELAVTP